MQIFPHSDVDMWGMLEWGVLGRRGWVFGPYFNDLSESTFGSLTMGKTVGAPSAWSKRVVPILLMSNGCALGVTCNKPIRVSFHIPLKSLSLFIQQAQRLNTYCIQRGNGAAHAWANMCLCSLHNYNLLHCNLLIFNIWHVCVLLRVPVCVISRVCARCGPAYRRILLTRSLLITVLGWNYSKKHLCRAWRRIALNF